MRQFLEEVEEAIRDRPDAKTKTYHLCDNNGEIVCLPKNKVEEMHILFKVSGAEVKEGYTCKGWQRIEDVLRFYYGKA